MIADGRNFIKFYYSSHQEHAVNDIGHAPRILLVLNLGLIY